MISDSPERYGTITRVIHWLIVIGLAWMLFTATAHLIDKDSVISKAVFPWHPQMGITLLLLGAARLIWLAFTHKNRPTAFSQLSRIGHWALYLLVVLIPTIALLRQYGSDRPLKYLGINVMETVGEKVSWMADLGNLVHGKLGWLLFALILGHIIMAFSHRKNSNSYIYKRMVGK